MVDCVGEDDVDTHATVEQARTPDLNAGSRTTHRVHRTHSRLTQLTQRGRVQAYAVHTLSQTLPALQHFVAQEAAAHDGAPAFSAPQRARARAVRGLPRARLRTGARPPEAC